MNKMITMGLCGGSVTIKYPNNGWHKIWLMKRINELYGTGLTWAKKWFEECNGTLHISPVIAERLIDTANIEIRLCGPAIRLSHSYEERGWNRDNLRKLLNIKKCLEEPFQSSQNLNTRRILS